MALLFSPSDALCWLCWRRRYELCFWKKKIYKLSGIHEQQASRGTLWIQYWVVQIFVSLESLAFNYGCFHNSYLKMNFKNLVLYVLDCCLNLYPLHVFLYTKHFWTCTIGYCVFSYYSLLLDKYHLFNDPEEVLAMYALQL